MNVSFEQVGALHLNKFESLLPNFYASLVEIGPAVL